MTPVVVDTNILFPILLRKQGRLRDVLFHAEDVQFFCCHFAIVELFKHKDKLLRYSGLSEAEMLEAFQSVLRRLSFYDELAISTSSVRKAYGLYADIDEKDTPFVALKIELNGLLWSGDRKLSDALHTKGFESFYVP